MFSLLRASFRQAPDYVIVGEVRGKEASVLFQGMASGHSSISTIHADSVDTLIKRLETPPIELSPTLLNVLDCVCIMTHAIVNKEETRKLKEVQEKGLIICATSQCIFGRTDPLVYSNGREILETGVIYLGGGTPKNYIQQAMQFSKGASYFFNPPINISRSALSILINLPPSLTARKLPCLTYLLTVSGSTWRSFAISSVV